MIDEWPEAGKSSLSHFPLLMTQWCRAKLIRALAVAFIGLELSACCFLPFSQGVIVDVTNDGSAPLSNLKVSFTGGERMLMRLEPRSTHEFRIKSTGDSGVSISFQDASGSAHSYELNVYLEPNYCGKIDIKVDRFGKITSQDEITVCPN
jgi:hypothetical protein